jgi:hypothetical protein
LHKFSSDSHKCSSDSRYLLCYREALLDRVPGQLHLVVQVQLAQRIWTWFCSVRWHRGRRRIDAFLAAARGRDFGGLLAVLDSDVVLRSDISPPLRGAAAVAGGASMFRHAGISATPVLVNGTAGIRSRTLDGRVLSVMSFTVARGRIVEIDVLANPARLRRLGLAV